MTERIKITEGDYEIKVDVGECTIEIFSSDGHLISNKEHASKIIQQILENQKIVDAILEDYNDTKSKEWYAIDEYSNMIKEIVQTATGKDIKEL